MPSHDLRTMTFARVYPAYVAKVERKGRTKAELDDIICWFTGYDAQGLEDQRARSNDFTAFFAEAPGMPPAAHEIKGLICGVRIEDLDDPVVQQVRRLDKIVDELAKGRKIDRIKRS